MSSIGRREFLKGALTAGAGAMAGVGLVGCAPAPASTAEDLPATGKASTARWSWEEAPEPITDVQNEIDADIVVIGGGISGVCAAQSAAEEGARVVLLEKTAQVNGHGLDIGNIGSKWFDENPEYARFIDAADAERIYYEFSHSNVNRLLFRFWAKNSGAAFDHLADYIQDKYGYEINMSATAPVERFDASEYYRELPTCLQFGSGWFDEEGNWWMQSIVNKIAAWAQDLGAEFLFETPAVQLVTDDSGAVVGVVGEGKDGYVRVNAAKGVIIATGDIGGSEEMLQAWCPLGLRVGANVYTPPEVNTGDGIRMALWAGADVQRGPAAPMIHPMGDAGPLSQGGEGLGFLSVNRDGERYGIELNNTPGMANSRLIQPGGISYSIFDGGYEAKVLSVKPDNIAITGAPIVDETTQATIDEAVAADNGLCFKADTIEELAEQIGADPATLRATVDRWNELCAKGEDEDMLMDSKRLTTLDTPPFYASYNPQAILVIIFGLNCDSHSRVCDKEDNPIPGLYAIGNAQGNFFALDYPLICPGISHGRCVTYGYYLPKAILAGELI